MGMCLTPSFKEHNDPPVCLELQEDATAHILKARPVLFALRTVVGAELQSIVSQGILQPTQYPEWSTPVVVVLKNTTSSFTW